MWARAEQVTLAWDANTEADLAGYKVHYGTVSGVYTATVDVHNVTTAVVTGLTAGQTYYFVVAPTTPRTRRAAIQPSDIFNTAPNGSPGRRPPRPGPPAPW